MDVSPDRGCRDAIRDHIRRCAHVIKAQRPSVRLWKLESCRLVYIPVPKVASSGIRQMLRARQRDEILAANCDSSINERELRQVEARCGYGGGGGGGGGRGRQIGRAHV